MVLISVAGVLSTPLLMLIEALQTHFDKPEIIFTLSDIKVKIRLPKLLQISGYTLH